MEYKWSGKEREPRPVESGRRARVNGNMWNEVCSVLNFVFRGFWIFISLSSLFAAKCLSFENQIISDYFETSL